MGACALSFAGSVPWLLREPLRDGRAVRQSAASYEALFAFDPSSWQGPVWDACAGRGGKTLALLEAGVEVALASDLAARRLGALPEELHKQRLAGIIRPPCLRVGSATDIPGLFTKDAAFSLAGNSVEIPDSLSAHTCPDRFRTVLVDAPCSGLGTLARHPEIRLRRTLDDCASLVEIQRNILNAVWGALLPGGLMVYLTCTRNKTENQEQTAAFLRCRAMPFWKMNLRRPPHPP